MRIERGLGEQGAENGPWRCRKMEPDEGRSGRELVLGRGDGDPWA